MNLCMQEGPPPKMWNCTLPAGHTGQHEAKTAFGLYTWPNKIETRGFTMLDNLSDYDRRLICAALSPRPLSEWHEDDGEVLWWRFPICQAPYVGTPLDDDFPMTAVPIGEHRASTEPYVTHWTPFLIPEPRTIDNTPCTCGEALTQEKGRHDEECPRAGL